MPMPIDHRIDRLRRRLGVGLGYSSAIEPLLEREPDLIDVLEIEPQTTWIKSGDRYRANEEVLRHLLVLPGRKLIHSVAAPVGGTVRPEASRWSETSHWRQETLPS